MQQTDDFSVDVIASAPISVGPTDFTAAQSAEFSRLIGELSADNESLKAEIDRLKGESDFEKIRAKLLGPYANRVYVFLVTYCIFVGAVLLLQGFSVWGFKLSDTVLAVISGSTAASAIGLVGFVVNGLFKNKTG